MSISAILNQKNTKADPLSIEELENLKMVSLEKNVEIVEVMNEQQLLRYRINCTGAISRNEKYIQLGNSETLKAMKAETNTVLRSYIEYIDEKLNGNKGLNVIDAFLNSWREKAFNHYVTLRKEVTRLKDRKKYRAEAIEQGLEDYEINHYVIGRINNELNYFFRNASKSDIDILTKYGSEESFLRNLNSHLDFEVLEKKNLIMLRVKKKVGNILDATNLRIGNNGEINGVIRGDKSVVHVHTIYAGGYRIRCLHFRVLVKEVK